MTGKTARARRLRRDSTDAERHLWRALRNRQIDGHKVRRQVPLGPYVVDFACLDRHLVIEIDGGQHARTEPFDSRRTAWLESQGFTVLRFWNSEISAETDAVLSAIREALRGG